MTIEEIEKLMANPDNYFFSRDIVEAIVDQLRERERSTARECAEIARRVGGFIEYPLTCGQEDYENYNVAQNIIGKIREKYGV